MACVKVKTILVLGSYAIKGEPRKVHPFSSSPSPTKCSYRLPAGMALGPVLSRTFYASFVDLEARPNRRNRLDLMFDPARMRPFVEEWEKVAANLPNCAACPLSPHRRFVFIASPPARRKSTALPLINETLNIYQGRSHNSRAQLFARLRAKRTVRCLDGEIRQVLANLISNALDAMSSTAGCLYIRTREATSWSTGERGIVFTVGDTGSGIAKETIKRVFEPFFTTKGTIGTGLGLWLSKEIIVRHHGVIRLRSSQSRAHHGTVFTMFLPFETSTRSTMASTS